MKKKYSYLFLQTKSNEKFYKEKYLYIISLLLETMNPNQKHPKIHQKSTQNQKSINPHIQSKTHQNHYFKTNSKIFQKGGWTKRKNKHIKSAFFWTPPYVGGRRGHLPPYNCRKIFLKMAFFQNTKKGIKIWVWSKCDLKVPFFY